MLNYKSRHPTIIVRLVNRLKRNEIYANCSKVKNIADFPVDNMRNLFVYENLRYPKTQKIILVNKAESQRIWDVNFMDPDTRKDDESEKIILRTKNDLKKL